MEDKKILTNEQKMAQAAWKNVSDRRNSLKNEDFDKYSSFALAFPALIHSCGLVQAVAFAATKKQDDYLADIQEVFDAVDKAGNLMERSREAGLAEYTRISRHALAAASWIKRYCQALDTGTKEE